MAKSPALSTQLKTAQAKIAELEKQNASKDSSMKYANDARAAVQAEIDQLHAFFDALPGAIPKEPEGSYGKTNTAMTRLAAWLATK